MAKKFKKSAVLGSQIAPSGNGPVTGGFQPKNDFFGPRSALTPLTSLETPTNLRKHLAKCQYLTQDRDSTKNWPFWRVFSSWNDHILWLGTEGKLTFLLIFQNFSLLFVLTHPKSCANGSVLKNTSSTVHKQYKNGYPWLIKGNGINIENSIFHPISPIDWGQAQS